MSAQSHYSYRPFNSVVMALTHVVQLPTARVHSLQQLIHLIITHLLPQVREDIPELSHADEAREVLVEDLEAAAVFFGLAGIAEAAGTVEDLLEGIKVDCVRSHISKRLQDLFGFCQIT